MLGRQFTLLSPAESLAESGRRAIVVGSASELSKIFVLEQDGKPVQDEAYRIGFKNDSGGARLVVFGWNSTRGVIWRISSVRGGCG